MSVSHPSLSQRFPASPRHVGGRGGVPQPNLGLQVVAQTYVEDHQYRQSITWSPDGGRVPHVTVYPFADKAELFVEDVTVAKSLRLYTSSPQSPLSVYGTKRDSILSGVNAQIETKYDKFASKDGSGSKIAGTPGAEDVQTFKNNLLDLYTNADGTVLHAWSGGAFSNLPTIQMDAMEPVTESVVSARAMMAPDFVTRPAWFQAGHLENTRQFILRLAAYLNLLPEAFSWSIVDSFKVNIAPLLRGSGLALAHHESQLGDLFGDDWRIFMPRVTSASETEVELSIPVFNFVKGEWAFKEHKMLSLHPEYEYAFYIKCGWSKQLLWDKLDVMFMASPYSTRISETSV